MAVTGAGEEEKRKEKAVEKKKRKQNGRERKKWIRERESEGRGREMRTDVVDRREDMASCEAAAVLKVTVEQKSVGQSQAGSCDCCRDSDGCQL